MADKSVSNPDVMFSEMLARINAYSEIAKENNYPIRFYTQTAPSKYHSNSDKYDWKTVRETKDYLQKVWEGVRAKAGKKGIRTAGLITTEPHKDSCPHRHIALIFRNEDEASEFDRIFEEHALREDGDEPGAKRHRLKIVEFDLSQASLGSYLFKYIAKNIEQTIERVEHFETDSDDAAARVQAWKRVHGLRQFQWIGPPVGIYRYMQRCDDPRENEKTANDPRIYEMWSACKANDYKKYIDLMGGLFSKKADRNFEIVNREHTNKYGEVIQRPFGVKAYGTLVIKRMIEWLMERKSAGAGVPWKTLNNCIVQIDQITGDIMGVVGSIDNRLLPEPDI